MTYLLVMVQAVQLTRDLLGQLPWAIAKNFTVVFGDDAAVVAARGSGLSNKAVRVDPTLAGTLEGSLIFVGTKDEQVCCRCRPPPLPPAPVPAPPPQMQQFTDLPRWTCLLLLMCGPVTLLFGAGACRACGCSCAAVRVKYITDSFVTAGTSLATMYHSRSH